MYPIPWALYWLSISNRALQLSAIRLHELPLRILTLSELKLTLASFSGWEKKKYVWLIFYLSECCVTTLSAGLDSCVSRIHNEIQIFIKTLHKLWIYASGRDQNKASFISYPSINAKYQHFGLLIMVIWSVKPHTLNSTIQHSKPELADFSRLGTDGQFVVQWLKWISCVYQMRIFVIKCGKMEPQVHNWPKKTTFGCISF